MCLNWIGTPVNGVEPARAETFSWCTGSVASRTLSNHLYPICIQRPDMSKVRPESRKHRNPVIYAKELQDEMVRDNLTRKQLSIKHGVSSDRITLWLRLLKIPEDVIQEVRTLGDNWDIQVITERKLRQVNRQ
jgi:hypothetical protein